MKESWYDLEYCRLTKYKKCRYRLSDWITLLSAIMFFFLTLYVDWCFIVYKFYSTLYYNIFNQKFDKVALIVNIYFIFYILYYIAKGLTNETTNI